MKKLNRKFYSVALFMVVLLFAFALVACQDSSEEHSSSAKASKGEESISQKDRDTKDDADALLDQKPEVAEIKKNNEPNRIITTFNGDSRTQMGFNWYTTDEFDDAQVWISTSKDLSDAKAFDAEATKVTNQYAERTKDGFYIYADVEKDDEGNPVEDDKGEPIINGYYTDEEKKGA